LSEANILLADRGCGWRLDPAPGHRPKQGWPTTAGSAQNFGASQRWWQGV